MMPPSSRQISAYCAPPSGMRRTSLVNRRWRYSAACGPLVSISPMWETSKTPAPWRTARCSSRIPAYCRGISQPANGTRRAPAARWRSWRGVRRSSLAGADMRPDPTGHTGRVPTAYLFDVNETLLDLSTLDGRVFGGDAGLRRAWFAQMLQNAMVTTILGGYRPFGELGAAALAMTAPDLDPEALRAGMASLPPHPDVRPALERLRADGVRLAPLTQSMPDVLERQLASAGIAGCFEAAFSAHDAGRLKPAPEPYRMAVERLGLHPEDVAMVAAHTWDVA